MEEESSVDSDRNVEQPSAHRSGYFARLWKQSPTEVKACVIVGVVVSIFALALIIFSVSLVHQINRMDINDGEGMKKCPDGWEEFNGKCYLSVNELKTWDEAERHCQSLNSHLASVHSIVENRFLVGRSVCPSRYEGRLCSWVGGTREGSKSWSWTDGSSWDFENWAPGQPSSSPDEDCIHFFSQDGTVPSIDKGKWNDAFCTHRFPFICSVPASDTASHPSNLSPISHSLWIVFLVFFYFSVFLCCVGCCFVGGRYGKDLRIVSHSPAPNHQKITVHSEGSESTFHWTIVRDDENVQDFQKRVLSEIEAQNGSVEFIDKSSGSKIRFTPITPMSAVLGDIKEIVLRKP